MRRLSSLISREPRSRRELLAAALLCMLSWPLAAQTESGNLYGTLKTPDGHPLPGATVQLHGLGASRALVSDAGGGFRFLGLAPGKYGLEASPDGFTSVTFEAVVLRVGRNTTLEIELTPEVDESITVTSDRPPLDPRKITRETNFDSVTLAKVPTSRDPWAMLPQAPGVLTNEVNVGGSGNADQDNFVAGGSTAFQNVFLVDGVNLTDMTARLSSTYYGFGQFEEIQYAIGGNDVAILTPGVQLNMVTKRGTNR